MFAQKKALILGVLLLILSFGGLPACAAAPPPHPTLSTTPTQPAPIGTDTPTPHIFPTLAPSRTATLIPTPTITPGPSPTATRQPALAGFTWQPQAVLVQAGMVSYDPPRAGMRTPQLILYADGSLLHRVCSAAACGYEQSSLPRQAVCQLLNSIDQLGFLDYDPVTYQPPAVGSHAVYFEVQAWRSNAARLDMLDRWIADPTWLETERKCPGCGTPPLIPPALANTFRLLWDYVPAKASTYQPQQLAVWLQKPAVLGKPLQWTLASTRLEDLAARAACPDGRLGQAVILSPPESDLVAGYISGAIAGLYASSAPVFSAGDLTLQVETQWLLPEEVPATCAQPAGMLPGPEVPTPAATLACRPSDGTLMTVTPTPHR